MSPDTDTEQLPAKRPRLRRSWRRRDIDSIASAPKRRRRRIIAGSVLAVILAGAAVWLVWFSDVLTVQQVRVVGVEGTAADEVLAAAAIPMGVQLARVDTDAAAARVHELGWVADGEVRRGWPHEAVIAVTARVPIAVLATSPTSGVDAEGVAFDVGTDPAQLRALPKVDAEGDALVAAMAVLAELPPDLAHKVDQVNAATKDSVELNLRSGHLVRWGSADRGAEKAAVLEALMERKGDVFDVTAPDAPTVYRG